MTRKMGAHRDDVGVVGQDVDCHQRRVGKEPRVGREPAVLLLLVRDSPLQQGGGIHIRPYRLGWLRPAQRHAKR